MDIEYYNRMEKMLRLRKELIASEEDRLEGREGYTLEEVGITLDAVINGV